MQKSLFLCQSMVKDNIQLLCSVGGSCVCMLYSGVSIVKCLGSIFCGSGGFEKSRFEKRKIK